MNEIRVPGLLFERYNTRFQGLLHKLTRPVAGTVCSYSNNLTSRPVNNSMHRPLKLKLQNALNQVILGDAESRGLFVGGRRRTRKKRKNRNAKEKKKTKKFEGKASPVLETRCNNEGVTVPADERPLIDSDFESTLSLTVVADDLHYVDDLPPLVDTEDQEDLDPEEMPFEFLKRKNKNNHKNHVSILEEELKLDCKEELSKFDEDESEEHQQVDHPADDLETKNIQNIQKQVDTPEAEDGTVSVAPEEEPTSLIVDTVVSDPDPLAETKEEIVPDVLEMQPEVNVEEMEKTKEEAVDEVYTEDGTPSEKVAIDNEQVEVKDKQPTAVNGTKIEESSPLIRKQEEEIDMNFMCCVIL